MSIAFLFFVGSHWVGDPRTRCSLFLLREVGVVR